MGNSILKLDEFDEEFDKLAREIDQATRNITETKECYALHAHQAAWHVKGMIYHCKTVHAKYAIFAEEVSKRAALGANAIWMYSPEFQVMMFEFYALINIARISLDNLRVYLSPTFATPFGQLPKSVQDFTAGETDCPVYDMIRKEPIFDYLIDCRNCIVHYRSFATSDNAIIVEQGSDTSNVFDHDDPLFQPMARAEFRRIDDTSIAVNVFLPDRIFDRGKSGKTLAPFTYAEKWNLLSMSVRFVHAVGECVLMAMKLLCEVKEPIYTYATRNK